MKCSKRNLPCPISMNLGGHLANKGRGCLRTSYCACSHRCCFLLEHPKIMLDSAYGTRGRHYPALSHRILARLCQSHRALKMKKQLADLTFLRKTLCKSTSTERILNSFSNPGPKCQFKIFQLCETRIFSLVIFGCSFHGAASIARFFVSNHLQLVEVHFHGIHV